MANITAVLQEFGGCFSAATNAQLAAARGVCSNNLITPALVGTAGTVFWENAADAMHYANITNWLPVISIIIIYSIKIILSSGFFVFGCCRPSNSVLDLIDGFRTHELIYGFLMISTGMSYGIYLLALPGAHVSALLVWSDSPNTYYGTQLLFALYMTALGVWGMVRYFNGISTEKYNTLIGVFHLFFVWWFYNIAAQISNNTESNRRMIGLIFAYTSAIALLMFHYCERAVHGPKVDSINTMLAMRHDTPCNLQYSQKLANHFKTNDPAYNEVHVGCKDISFSRGWWLSVIYVLWVVGIGMQLDRLADEPRHLWLFQLEIDNHLRASYWFILFFVIMGMLLFVAGILSLPMTATCRYNCSAGYKNFVESERARHFKEMSCEPIVCYDPQAVYQTTKQSYVGSLSQMNVQQPDAGTLRVAFVQ